MNGSKGLFFFFKSMNITKQKKIGGKGNLFNNQYFLSIYCELVVKVIYMHSLIESFQWLHEERGAFIIHCFHPSVVTRVK